METIKRFFMASPVKARKKIFSLFLKGSVQKNI